MVNYLPIGTVVLLKNGKKPVIIMGYKVVSADGNVYKDDKVVKSDETYDYGALPYPEGIISSAAICMFNHSDIQKVLYMGYVSDEYRQLLKLIHENEK